MAAALLTRISGAIRRVELAVASLLARNYPPELCVIGVDVDRAPRRAAGAFDLNDLIGDGFVWAVPRSRRTLERRHKRKYGCPEYVEKILRPKTNIKTCDHCGDDHLIGVLCPTCYKKVMDETKRMQDAIVMELKLEPVEKEVVVLYEGEKDEKPSEYWEGKRIVEIESPRPSWFSKNLLQKTTQQPATTSDVKPSDLG